MSVSELMWKPAHGLALCGPVVGLALVRCGFRNAVRRQRHQRQAEFPLTFLEIAAVVLSLLEIVGNRADVVIKLGGVIFP